MKPEHKDKKGERPYKVYAITEGVVIDHIPAGKSFRVIKVLGLKKDLGDSILTLGVNLDSKIMGKKDVLKIENRKLTEAELNKLALVAPKASINMIKDSKVYEKRKIEFPNEFEGLIRCPNPKCITNHQPVKTIFYSQGKINPSVKCYFCEKVFELDEVELI